MIHKTNGVTTLFLVARLRLMAVYVDFVLPIFTCCLRWHKNDVSHLINKFASPNNAHLVSRVW